MRIGENYFSISGEGVHVGIPTQIVRLAGCNLKCKWCDTAYAQDLNWGEEVKVEDVAAYVSWPRWALITGGEPLLQADLYDLVRALRRRDVKVEIETNGSIEPPTWWQEVDCWSADIKCPSSGMEGKSKLAWLNTRVCDQVKFVVANEEDLSYAVGILAQNSRLDPTVLVSPAYPWTQEWLQRCARFCKKYEVRLSLQLHKIIYGCKKGV